MNLTSTLNLASQTILQRDQLKKSKTFLNLLIEHPDSTQFHQPVDWQSLGISDYPLIIKKPMDLDTVNQKLKSNQYQWLEEMLDDVQIIWDNCKLYNQAGSWIYMQADKMEKFFKKLVKNYFTGVPLPHPRNSVTQKGDHPKPNRRNNPKAQTKERIFNEQESSGGSLSKKQLVQKWKQLSPEQLGQIVELILISTPEVCKRKNNNYQICIPQIEQWLWSQIKEKMGEFDDSFDMSTTKKQKI